MEIDAIKKKVLEDVDPETRRKKKKEMRIQRLIVTLQFLGIAAVVILILVGLILLITGVVSFLAPVIVPIFLVILLFRLFGNRR